jgi:hypothetical protein
VQPLLVLRVLGEVVKGVREDDGDGVTGILSVILAVRYDFRGQETHVAPTNISAASEYKIFLLKNAVGFSD